MRCSLDTVLWVLMALTLLGPGTAHIVWQRLSKEASLCRPNLSVQNFSFGLNYFSSWQIMSLSNYLLQSCCAPTRAPAASVVQILSNPKRSFLGGFWLQNDSLIYNCTRVSSLQGMRASPQALSESSFWSKGILYLVFSDRKVIY